MVEVEIPITVNQGVVGSSPTWGANNLVKKIITALFYDRAGFLFITIPDFTIIC